MGRAKEDITINKDSSHVFIGIVNNTQVTNYKMERDLVKVFKGAEEQAEVKIKT